MRLFMIAAVVMVGCAAPPPPSPPDRHTRLLSLAAGEAGQIADAHDRLQRQLNLADRQLDDGRPAEGRRTLAAAARSLRAVRPGELPPLLTIAGWVSISELSRRAEDRPAADAACGRAVSTLRALDPPTDRAEFAVGVSTEVRALHGKPAAAALLVESAGWAGAIADAPRRREALREIADATFDCDDYPGGLAIVRADPDPAWRSDTLASLAGASALGWASSVGSGSVPGSIAANAELSHTESSEQDDGAALRMGGPRSDRFEKAVDFRSVFQSR